MNPNSTCSFTGHRPEKLPWGNNEEDERCLHFKEQLHSAIQTAYDAGYRNFLCGMARGADLIFCEEALALRERQPDVRVAAIIPFPAQAEHWPLPDRERYDALLSRCDLESVISHHYSRGCLQRRNRYLVDHSSHLIAAYNGQGGGTKYTITYAIERGLRYKILDV